MGHPIHRIKAFEIAGPYRLRIEFGDGVVRTIDFRPILEGVLYGRGAAVKRVAVVLQSGRSGCPSYRRRASPAEGARPSSGFEADTEPSVVTATVRRGDGDSP